MKIIFEKQPYKITFQNKADLKIIDLLKRTLWGTKEMLYQHMDTEQHIVNVPDPVFFSMEKHDELIGTCCFSKRSLTINRQIYNCWYTRYFSIDPQKQGGIFGSMILKHIRTYFERETPQPTFFYAYVDASNVRSKKLITHTGFEKIRSFETLTFSRLYPKNDKRAVLLAKEDTAEMLRLLQEAYKGYMSAQFDTVFSEGSYFVLKIENEIVAGIHVSKAHWVIRHLQGFSGTLIMNVVPHIPVLSRLFNPKEFRFAAFDGIYCKAGYEKDFFTLMESVCASLQMHTGIMWLDSDSPLYHRLKKAGNWGIVDKLKNNIPAYVVAAFKNIPVEEQKTISSIPMYISAVDII